MQKTIPNTLLATVYQTTPRQIRRWQEAKAPLHDPNHFREWLYAREGRASAVRDMLDDSAARAQIKAFLEGEPVPPLGEKPAAGNSALEKIKADTALMVDYALSCRLLFMLGKVCDPALEKAVIKAQTALAELTGKLYQNEAAR